MSKTLGPLLSDVVKLMTTNMLARNFEDALDCAIFARFLSRDDPKPNPTQAALTCIRDCASELTGVATPTFTPKKAAVACSFCGCEPPDARLGAGPGVFICHECADTFSKALAASPAFPT